MFFFGGLEKIWHIKSPIASFEEECSNDIHRLHSLLQSLLLISQENNSVVANYNDDTVYYWSYSNNSMFLPLAGAVESGGTLEGLGAALERGPPTRA